MSDHDHPGRWDEQQSHFGRMEVRVFSTYDGAKKCARMLHDVFTESGYVFPLHKCHLNIALAAGFRDWHHLKESLRARPQSCDLGRFRERLIDHLPEACHAPARAWLDREPFEKRVDPDIPARWFRDVFPVLFASAIVHRTHTSQLLRGTGMGQQLRQKLVVGLLMNENGGHRLYPQLDPDTLEIAFAGDLESLYGDTVRHHRFEREFAALVEEGILSFDGGVLRVSPPNRDALMASIRDRKLGLVHHWLSADGAKDELANALREALAGIGVDNALSVAIAIADQGSSAFTVPSGTAITCLSDLAKAGRIDTFERAYDLFSTVLPGGHAGLRDWVPAQILSTYIGGYRRVPMGKALSWTGRNDDWADTLKNVLMRPGNLAPYVESIIEEMEAA